MVRCTDVSVLLLESSSFRLWGLNQFFARSGRRREFTGCRRRPDAVAKDNTKFGTGVSAARHPPRERVL